MNAQVLEYMKSTIAGLEKAISDFESEKGWYKDAEYTMRKIGDYNPSIEEIQKACAVDLGKDHVRFQHGEYTTEEYIAKTIKDIDEQIRFLRIKRRWHIDKLNIFVEPYADTRYHETEHNNPGLVRLRHQTVEFIQDSWRKYEENLKVAPWPPQWDKYL